MTLKPWARIAAAFLALVSILISHAGGQASGARGPLRRAVVDLVIGGPDEMIEAGRKKVADEQNRIKSINEGNLVPGWLKSALQAAGVRSEELEK